MPHTTPPEAFRAGARPGRRPSSHSKLDIFVKLDEIGKDKQLRIPSEFDAHGHLASHDFTATFAELADSILVRGPAKGRSTWDSTWRARLVANASVLARQLWCVGISEIYLDGSFVDDKDHPNDIDGYFVCRLDELASGELEARLNKLDPNRSWTWAPESRWPYRAYGKLQLPMWHLYRVELYPHVGQLSGIVDEYGYELEFPSAFRRARDGRRRGVVRVIPEE